MSFVTFEQMVKAQPQLATAIGILHNSPTKPLNEIPKSAYIRGVELVAERVWTEAELTEVGSFVVYLDHVVHAEVERGFLDAIGVDLLNADMPSIVVAHPECASRLLKIALFYDKAGIPFASQYSVSALPDPTGL